MPLSAGLQQKLAQFHFTTPTPVQASAIPPALEGKDVSGHGPNRYRQDPGVPDPHDRAAGDAGRAATKFPRSSWCRRASWRCRSMSSTKNCASAKLAPAALVIGGVSEQRQIQAVRRGASVVVATPGRLEDFLRRKLVNLRSVTTLVLDESDRMLDMGFLPAIRRIAAELPRDRQTMCFSATLEASVAHLVNDYMKNPVRIALGSISKPADTVELHAFEVPLAEKSEVLRQLLYADKGQTLIFARTKRGTERLAKNLVRDGFSAAMIHGDRSQSQRTGALPASTRASSRCWWPPMSPRAVSTLQNVAHVINYDLPQIPEDFIHRVGRTGRMGSAGRASTLVSGTEIGELRSIERALKLKIARKQMNGAGRHRDAAGTKHTAHAHAVVHGRRSVLLRRQLR